MNLWPYICGFLAFPTIMGLYYLIVGYIRLYFRVSHLEWLREGDKKEHQDLYNRVIFEIPAIMRKNGWTL